ncbi:hypothetical protein IJG90_01480 [Candidatus Saccharibacteria bacterium]|nr:hypothetical protein [Candidatus Saccharibacteria bacterium]
MKFYFEKGDKGDYKDVLYRLYLELYVAYRQARAGKRLTPDEMKIELDIAAEIMRLAEDLLNKTYEPARGTAHVIFYPVMREIFAATFRDRVVHHWIYNNIYDWWDRRFIYDSYSCREGKGTLFGISRLEHHILSVSENYQKPDTYVIKMDIEGYFMHLPRKELYKRVVWGLDRQFEDHFGWRYEILKFAIRQVIFDDPCKGVTLKGWPEDWEKLPPSKSLLAQEPDIGIVIGNLTSQMFSNIYLDLLDKYVTRELGYKHYGRYVDDFYIVVRKSELKKALKDVERIKNFLISMKLNMHPKKFGVYLIRYGVPFLGARVYPWHISPGKRLRSHYREAVRAVAMGEKSVESIESYVGHMKYFNAHNAIWDVFEELALDDYLARNQ